MKGDIEIKEKLLLIVNVLKKDLNYKFTLEDIFSPVRDKDLVTIRSIISYCLRKHNYSYPQICSLLNRTQSTIINLYKHI
ncbi:MAG: helix-turn-helix domain-containing protein [Bacteroidia bacterium]